MRTAIVLPKDRFDLGKEVMVIQIVVLMHRDRASVAALKHRQRNIIALHIAKFGRNEAVEVLVANLLQHFTQAGRTGLGGHLVFHLIEAHVAHVGEHLEGIVHRVGEADQVPGDEVQERGLDAR